MNYPKQCDIIYFDFSPTIGHEQSGSRLALVISESSFNKKSGLCVVCPISSVEKGHLFEVKVENENIQGVILTQQIKTIDWEGRKFKKICTIDQILYLEVFHNINNLISLPIAE